MGFKNRNYFKELSFLHRYLLLNKSIKCIKAIESIEEVSSGGGGVIVLGAGKGVGGLERGWRGGNDCIPQHLN